jgi:adenylate cyclase
VRGRASGSHGITSGGYGASRFELLDAVRRRSGQGPSWGVRIGINTGPVIAGIVGIRKFAFDIWGESVNVSSRMESSGVEGCINVSQQTYARIKDFFVCESRGQIVTKDKVGQEMFFVRGVLPTLMEGAEPGIRPPLLSQVA